MTEEKVKKRGWVKNAAIIFLAVLLALTFFSNTIMNRSLPEVAAQYAQAGTITTRIRGTGTVTANENYEVVIDQSREVESVAVKVGDTVIRGDTLFYLADKDSDELKQAENTLSDLNYQYQEAVINASQGDYALENRDIQLARQALEEAIAERDSKVISNEELQTARNNVQIIKNDISARKTIIAVLQANVDKAQADLNALGGRSDGNDSSGLYSALLEAQDDLNQANAALNTAKLRFQSKYDVLLRIAGFVKTAKESVPGAPVFNIAIYLAARAEEYKEATAASDTSGLLDIPEVDETDPLLVIVDGTTYKKVELAEAYYAIQTAQDTVNSCQSAYNAAYNSYYSSFDSGNATLFDSLSKILSDAQKELATAQSALELQESRLEIAQTALTDAETRNTEYKAAVSAARAAQTALEDKLFALEEQQKADGKAQSLQSLQIAKLRDQVVDAEAEVERLRSSAVDAAVTAKVDGVIKSLNVTAGHSTEPGVAMATIEVQDQGFSVSMTVTTEQAKKVSIGDSAEITTGYWGAEEITARLATMRPDPQAPNQSKILDFDITGEIESGTQVSLSIGQKSQNYEVIVPNSAIRSDSNGDFVLIVLAKSSPLGNRYIATRVDVQVLATDDMNSAISGGVANGDFVITTATRPLESGMQVRMAEV